MSIVRFVSLKTKLILFITLAITLSLFFFAAVILSYEVTRAKTTEVQDTLVLVGITASTSTAALAFLDQKALSEYLESLGRRSDFIAACIYDAEGRISGKYLRPGEGLECPPQPDPDGFKFVGIHLLQAVAPIQLGKQRLGTIFVASDLSRLRGELKFHAKLVGYVLLLAIGVGLLFSRLIQRYISAPILSLASMARIVSEKKDYSLRVQVGRKDELGVLMETFNGMLAQIEAQNAERERLLLEAQNAVRVRDDFMAIASHELKTPLTPLRTQVQMLQRLSKTGALKTIAPEKLEKLMNFTDNQVTRLTSLIEDLLDVTRITSGKMRLRPEKIHIASLIRDLLQNYQQDIQRTTSRIDTDLDEKVTAVWDRFRIEQVLTNLLTNALRYGQGKAIKISSHMNQGYVTLTVHDNGIGIESEAQQRIFNRFERAVPSAHYGGLGLGLYIAKQIVVVHGGTIRVESIPGAGSTFIVQLPTQVEFNSSVSA
jgi:signal transduction histidine kinase